MKIAAKILRSLINCFLRLLALIEEMFVLSSWLEYSISLETICKISRISIFDDQKIDENLWEYLLQIILNPVICQVNSKLLETYDGNDDSADFSMPQSDYLEVDCWNFHCYLMPVLNFHKIPRVFSTIDFSATSWKSQFCFFSPSTGMLLNLRFLWEKKRRKKFSEVVSASWKLFSFFFP